MTLSYETAKKLKDAGFPQDKCHGKIVYSVLGHNWLTAPLLEELIEACGDVDFILKKTRGAAWLASDYHNEDTNYALGLIGVSETPSEAVASLWLALNKN